MMSTAYWPPDVRSPGHGDTWVGREHELQSGVIVEVDEAGEVLVHEPLLVPASVPPGGGYLVVNPHPLTLEGRRIVPASAWPAGATLLEVCAAADVDVSHGDWMLAVGGAEVPIELWHVTRPKPGQVLTARRLPGRDAVRAFAFIALSYYTMGAGMPGWLSGNSFGMFALRAGVFILGAAVVNKLLPPPAARLPSYDTSTGGATYTLTGGQNRLRPYEPIGLLFGTTKVVPDYAAQPYAWFEGDDQFQSLRFSAGINCNTVGSLAFGDTPLTSYSDYIETRVGFPSGNSVDAYWANVDTVAGALLSAPSAPGAWVVRTSSAGTVRLAVDLVANLYTMNDEGDMTPSAVQVEIEYRLLPAGAWTALSTVTLSSSSTKPVRRTVLGPLVAEGQYEVRCRKLQADVSTTRAANEVQWQSLKSYQADEGDYSGLPQYGLRIKASGQLNGAPDAVNWVAQQLPTPVWNGTAWVNESTSNPGAQILQFARGIYAPRGRSLAGRGMQDPAIDIERLKLFMLHCQANGYTFNHWFDTALSCHDLMEAMAFVGLGSISQHGGKLGVVWAAPGQPVEDIVNMANIKAGTFAVEHASRELADELEVSWRDAASGYKTRSIRLLAPGVTVPRDTARLAPAGIDSEAGAVRLGRWTMAQNLYGRKSVTWEMDLEHMAFRRFSVIALSHDLTRWGHGGRLRSAVNVAGVVTLELDALVPAAATRFVALRIPSETTYRVFGVASFAGQTHTLVLTSAWPSGVPLPGDTAENPAEDTLWLYDVKAAPGMRMRVSSIEPMDGMKGARITAVPEPDEFWDYMATGAYVATAAPAPATDIELSNLRVAQRRLDVNYGNQTELLLSFDVDGPAASFHVYGAPSGETLLKLGESAVPRFGPVLVGNDGVYVLEVRAFDGLGRVRDVVSVAYSVTLGAVLGGGSVSLLTMQTTAQAFTFNSVGAAAPSGQTISFTAQLANLTGTATWACTLYDLAGTSLGAGTLGGSGNTRTLTVANFGAAAYAVVQASLSGFSDQATVVRLRDGVAAVSGWLTNEAHTVATAADGSGGVYTSAGGTFKVLNGTTDVTALATFSVVSSGGISGLAIDAAGVYTLTGTTADVGTAVLRAVFGGVTIDKVYTISRSRQGAQGLQGANAQLLTLLSSAQAFTFDGAGAATPAGQSITLTAQLANVAGTASFGAELFNAAGASLGAATLGGSGNTRTLSVASFGAAAYAVVQASLSGLNDQVTVVRLRDGAPGANGSNGTDGTDGADGQNAVSGFLTNEAHTVATAADGSGGSYGSAGGTFKVFNGTTDVTASATFSVVGSSGISGMAIDAAGVYTLTGTTADIGTATLRAVFSGVTLDKVYTISRSRQGNAGTPGANATLLTLLSTAQAFTFDTLGGQRPSGQTISFTAQLANLSGTATFVCELFSTSGASLGTVTMGGSGNTRTLTIAQFGSALYATVVASFSGLSDQVTVNRLVAGPPTSGVVSPGYLTASDESLAPAIAEAGFRFKRDGGIDILQAGSWTSYGAWELGGGATVGDLYDVRFDVITSQGTVTGSTPGAWLQINTNRSIIVQDEALPGSEAHFNYFIRRRSDGTTLVFGPGYLIAQSVP